MGSTACVNCGQPLPAGAAFCGACGARQTLVNQGAPSGIENQATQLTPPPPPASALDTDPTRLSPPPPPASAFGGGPAAGDVYAAQYAPPPPPGGQPPYSQYGGPGSGPSAPYSSGPSQQAQFAPPPPPGYAPGPPPVMTPQGGVAPWAQPQKGGGRRVAMGLIVAVVLVVLVLGGGGVLAYTLLHKNSGNTANQNNGGTHPGASPTTGAGSTPSPGTTPTPNLTGAQTLNNLNLQAIYAGVTITMMNATQFQGGPNAPVTDPTKDVLKIQGQFDNSVDTHDVSIDINTNVVGPDGNPYPVVNLSDSLPGTIHAQRKATGYWYFYVPHGTQISDWNVVIGSDNEAQETIPLTGANYDASMWQETPTPIGKMVTYYGGSLVATVVKVATGVWTPGYQAPKGMRFILVDLMVTNNSASSVYVGDPEFTLLLPDGTRHNQDSSYGYFINDALGGHESKDEGYACFLVPPDKGDFQMIFFNQDNGVAGMVDLGTL